MKKIFTLILCLFLFINTSIISYAAPNLKALQTGKYLSLSEQDKKDTIEAMTRKIIKELDIKKEIKISFYEASDWIVVASNTAQPDFKYDEIRYNMAFLRDDSESKAAQETIEYFIVKTIAHEVRHSYQIDHIMDDTPYGNAVRIAKSNYTAYYKDLNAYYANFLEADATAYGVGYADQYVKNGKLVTTTLVAKDGKVFDPVFYAAKYADVKNALGTDPQILLNHYNTFGINEGRMANANDIR